MTATTMFGSVDTARRTSFSPPTTPTAAKASIGFFALTLAPPLFPAPIRTVSNETSQFDNWFIVEASYPQQALRAMHPARTWLWYADSVVALPSTSVSLDVLRSGAPGLWNYCFDDPLGGFVEAIVFAPQARGFAAFVDSLIHAVYVRRADAVIADEEGESIDDGDEAEIHQQVFRSIEHLRSFLGWTDAQLAGASGFSRSSLHNWEHGIRPQAAKVAKLLAIDALVISLRRRLGDDRLRAWLASGSPSRISRVLAGKLATVSREAEALLFPPAVVPRAASGYWGEVDSSNDDVAERER
jgi:transcriptional regulator with XRE-family HTH domain